MLKAEMNRSNLVLLGLLTVFAAWHIAGWGFWSALSLQIPLLVASYMRLANGMICKIPSWEVLTGRYQRNLMLYHRPGHVVVPSLAILLGMAIPFAALQHVNNWDTQEAYAAGIGLLMGGMLMGWLGWKWSS